VSPKSSIIHHFRLFLLSWSSGLLCALGHFATALNLLNGLDDTDGHGLTHVTEKEKMNEKSYSLNYLLPDSKASQWSIVGESLNTKWLGWNQIDNALNVMKVRMKIFSSIRNSNLHHRS
jgi:hypothetical protein